MFSRKETMMNFIQAIIRNFSFYFILRFLKETVAISRIFYFLYQIYFIWQMLLIGYGITTSEFY